MLILWSDVSCARRAIPVVMRVAIRATGCAVGAATVGRTRDQKNALPTNQPIGQARNPTGRRSLPPAKT